MTPAHIKRLAQHRPDGMHGSRHHHIKRLATRLPDDIEPHPHTVIAAHQIHKELLSIEPELARNQQAISAMIDEQPYVELTALWRTVPASNDLTIATLHAATRGRAREYSREAFKSALGTNPQGKSSGKTSSAFQSRRGYSPAAGLIHLWTMALMRKSYSAQPGARLLREDPAASTRWRRRGTSWPRILWGIAVHGTPCNWPTSQPQGAPDHD